MRQRAPLSFMAKLNASFENVPWDAYSRIMALYASTLYPRPGVSMSLLMQLAPPVSRTLLVAPSLPCQERCTYHQSVFSQILRVPS